jgi:ribosome-binding factor A
MATRSNGKHSKVKYQELIMNELNTYLRTQLSDPRFITMSITKVELNVDYSKAKVYWDTFDAHTRGDAKRAIEQSKGKLRSLLAKNLNLRHVPELHFAYDSQYEDELKITQILDQAQNGSDE